MKENNELTRDDIAIDHDMEVDCDEGREIAVYIETWFDVDKKFHIDTASDDDTWLNMYGRYNPFDDTLRIECEISRQDSSSYFDYEPTKDEAQLIKDMIAEKISYDDQIVRQILESVIIESKDRIKVVFIGGLEVTQLL